jgi:hypothetical protein
MMATLAMARLALVPDQHEVIEGIRGYFVPGGVENLKEIARVNLSFSKTSVY